MRKTLNVSPWVTMTTVQSSVLHPVTSQLNLPKCISLRNVSRKDVTRSYTSAADSPFGNRKKNRPNRCRSLFSSAIPTS
eukprot:31141-Pelagococcus_subviridis.AAC.4